LPVGTPGQNSIGANKHALAILQEAPLYRYISWKGRPVVVTGGASFIGSHLVDALAARGATVLAVDDLSTGRVENLEAALQLPGVRFTRVDLFEPGAAHSVLKGASVVFHLAARHGGRGYIDTHPADCATNLALDAQVFRAALDARVDKVVFASSGCVYPVSLQTDTTAEVRLDEQQVGPPYDPDGLYGWAKLSGELSLAAYRRQYGMSSVSLRYFTVYGERCDASHAVIAMMARALLRQDPFEIWGDGRQIRNWTYVSDIVQGTILAAERLTDGQGVNVGTREPVTVIEAAKLISSLAGYAPKYRFLADMPTGPVNRVCDDSLAHRMLDWRAGVTFTEGVRRTWAWYSRTHRREDVEEGFARRLLER
jgi:nucleoside-diphosphate-sugar epimerase